MHMVIYINKHWPGEDSNGPKATKNACSADEKAKRMAEASWVT